ncbi:hypothetical protein [Filomicrobium sp.]|uniref:hypothetical protein n=1 Tax=Filomicrobium sp. TaxID=2024831 RepID=UPI002587F7C5|nr:hypothetical protein [Filomicrobium sp.]MCV0370434.1 hypothetical protein [Filomicrobium sp.]
MIDDFTLMNNNNTPVTALGFPGPFPRTVDALFDDGGSGGTGGAAVVLEATSDDTFENLGTIIGGAGGAGSAAAIVNRGSIRGGAGGAGGVGGAGGSDGSDGAGGIGIVGSDLTITNSGTIAGGLDGDVATRADAIHFTGGTNTLILEAGSTITGTSLHSAPRTRCLLAETPTALLTRQWSAPAASTRASAPSARSEAGPGRLPAPGPKQLTPRSTMEPCW